MQDKNTILCNTEECLVIARNPERYNEGEGREKTSVFLCWIYFCHLILRWVDLVKGGSDSNVVMIQNPFVKRKAIRVVSPVGFINSPFQIAFSIVTIRTILIHNQVIFRIITGLVIKLQLANSFRLKRKQTSTKASKDKDNLDLPCSPRSPWPQCHARHLSRLVWRWWIDFLWYRRPSCR